MFITKYIIAFLFICLIDGATPQKTNFFEFEDVLFYAYPTTVLAFKYVRDKCHKHAEFKKMEQEKTLMLEVDLTLPAPQQCSRDLVDALYNLQSSQWAVIPSGLVDPFSENKKHLIYTARFDSEISSGITRLHRVQYSTSVSTVTVLVKKDGDLRLDAFYLQLAEHFNQMWRNRPQGPLTYRWNNEQTPTSVAVHIYKVCPSATRGGLVEYLPGSKPFSEMYNYDWYWLRQNRAHNDLKFDERGNVVASAVGGSVVAYLLDLGDQHHDNQLVLEDSTIVFIDFSYLGGESPGLFDTAYFPLPYLYRALLVNEGQWEEFKRLCWEALQVLKENRGQVYRLIRAAGRHVQPSLSTAILDSIVHKFIISEQEFYNYIEAGPRKSLPKNILHSLFK